MHIMLPKRHGGSGRILCSPASSFEAIRIESNVVRNALGIRCTPASRFLSFKLVRTTPQRVVRSVEKDLDPYAQKKEQIQS